MKERPILFNGPMVRAILDAHKTQTRRVLRSQPSSSMDLDLRSDHRGAWATIIALDGTLRGGIPCPYGQPGDHLWVRETWAPADRWADGYDRDDPTLVAYAADGKVLNVEDGTNKWLWDGWEHYMHWHALKERKWKPSIHMPRWASRLTLRVTGVRVERLRAITEEDAIAEGCDWAAPEWHGQPVPERDGDENEGPPPSRGYRGYARDNYRRLWDSINGHRAPWDSDPWVFCVSFERVTPQPRLLPTRRFQ